jgi:hypothetical protein
MKSMDQAEAAIEELWKNYAVRPTEMRVNPELMRHLAEHRPGGGNSHQRRVWRRMWTFRGHVGELGRASQRQES